mmetsp:Transcript_3254/g.5046  ORF Transcript_3254/g.5046 Transcript_3254/m.5046 type:complete len:298 (-) Transcript_3254:30-923(-)
MSYRAKKSKPPVSIFEKKLPENPKYSHITSKLDTGLTVDKVKYVTTREYLKHRDESHYRVTPFQLSQLLSEYETDFEQNFKDIKNCSNFESEPIVTNLCEESLPEYARPYLILDLRNPEEFQSYRILQSRNFPAVYMNQDRTLPELYRFKNRAGTLIILYSNEEKLACKVGHSLIHRGFNNVYVLTGGISELIRKFPKFVEGNVPRLEDEGAKKPRRRPETEKNYERTGNLGSKRCPVRVSRGSEKNNMESELSRRDEVYHSKGSAKQAFSRKQPPFSESGMSVAESVISKASARKF